MGKKNGMVVGIKVEKREKDGRKEWEMGVIIKEEKGTGEYLIKKWRKERRVEEKLVGKRVKFMRRGGGEVERGSLKVRVKGVRGDEDQGLK